MSEIKVHRLPSGEKKRLRKLAFNEVIPAGAYQMLEGGPLLPIQPTTVGETPHGFGGRRSFWVPTTKTRQ